MPRGRLEAVTWDMWNSLPSHPTCKVSHLKPGLQSQRGQRKAHTPSEDCTTASLSARGFHSSLQIIIIGHMPFHPPPLQLSPPIINTRERIINDNWKRPRVNLLQPTSRLLRCVGSLSRKDRSSLAAGAAFVRIGACIRRPETVGVVWENVRTNCVHLRLHQNGNLNTETASSSPV